MRTITNPAEDSALSSSTIRTELQTLETEIANTSTGHSHDSSDSRQVDHTDLANIGANTHSQIDTAVSASTSHISNTSNPHSVTKTQVGLGNCDNTSDLNKPISTATQSALDGKVDENVAITGATKTKITYDAKGLVTSGADATTADIADSTDKRYVTDAQLVVIGNTSGTNTGDQNLSGYVTKDQTTGQTIGDTTNRLTKLWATDITCTNAIAGSVTGNAATVTNATLTTALTVNTGTVTLKGDAANTSALTIGSGAVSVSGSNTGDQTSVSGNAGTATTLQTARNINGVSFNGSADITVPDIITTRLPAVDHTATGVKITAVATQNQAIGDAVAVASTGKFTLAKADVIANATAIAMVCDATISADATGNYLLMGTIRDDTWNWTVGGTIYLSTTGTTGNTLTQTEPSSTDNVVQILGVATAADEMYFNPQLVQVEVV